MRRSHIEQYIDILLALLEGEANRSELYDKCNITPTKIKDYITTGKAKGHIDVLKNGKPSIAKLTERGELCCQYWLTLREKFNEKMILSNHDLDSDSFEDMVDFQLLKSEEFREKSGLKFLYERVKPIRRSSFELKIDFMRLLYKYHREKVSLKQDHIVRKVNINIQIEDLRKSAEETKLIKVIERPGRGRLGRELYFSLEPRGVSYITNYEGYFLMFDLNEFLGTRFKVSLLENNQKYSHSRRSSSTLY